MTKIEWTEKTWNIITGCNKISEGCRNCYAEVMTKRLQCMGIKKYEAGFNVIRFHPEVLNEPNKWKKPSMVFVCSMSDMFHYLVKDDEINQILKVIEENKQHIFQILTKRIYDARHFIFPDNVWLGTTIENDRELNRLEFLKQCKAKTKFISFEPLLTEIPKLDLEGINWVIVGGESGKNARPMQIEWAEKILNNCRKYNVKFFMKQLSKKGNSKYKDFNEFPKDLQIREYPEK